MKQPKLNVRFHNPNTAEATADFLWKLLVQANREKLEQALRDAQVDEAKNEAGDRES